MRRRSLMWIAISAIIAVGVIALLVALGATDRTTGESKSSAATPATAGGAMNERAASDTAVSGSLAGDSASQTVSLPTASAPSTHYLVRTGDLSLLVARDSLAESVDRVTAITAALGGYVVSSAMGSDPGWPMATEPVATDGQSLLESNESVATSGGDGYASMTVRVPEGSFDTALRRYQRLGEVQSVSTSSNDVTTQYVDLEARLAHYRAVERRLVRFLAATRNISQMLAVQDRIDKAQLTIEQLTAELKALRETTTYATLSIGLRERDDGGVAAASSFGGTLRHSLALLWSGAHVAALAVVAALPFVVVLGSIAVLVWLAVRRLRRDHRRSEPPSLPA